MLLEWRFIKTKYYYYYHSRMMDRKLHFQDFSDVVYHTSVAINTLSTIYFGIFCDNGAFSSIFLTKLMLL